MADPPGEDPDRELFEAAIEQFSRGRGRAVVHEKEAIEPPPGAGSPAPLAPKRTRRVGRDAELDLRSKVSSKLDLHGLDVDEALQRVDQFLARQQRRSVVVIVHGRGTQRLARAVRTSVERDGRVLRHAPAPPSLGGGGARVVWMR